MVNEIHGVKNLHNALVDSPCVLCSRGNLKMVMIHCIEKLFFIYSFIIIILFRDCNNYYHLLCLIKQFGNKNIKSFFKFGGENLQFGFICPIHLCLHLFFKLNFLDLYP